MAEQSPIRRSFWGLDPAAVEELLAEQEGALLREREVLERAVNLAESEVERLEADCEHLHRQISYAEQRLVLARQSVQRQRSLPPAQALALHQHLQNLEREHQLRMEGLHQEEASLRARVEGRHRSLHQWVMGMLQSVADREEPSA